MSSPQSVVALRDPRGPETMFAGAPDTPGTQADSRAAAAAAPRSAALPLALGLLTLVTTLGYQAWQLDQDRRQLESARANLQPTLDTAQRLRRSLDLLAADTQRLADGGNGNAKVLVGELKKRGITINAAATAATASPAPAEADKGK